MRELDNSLLWGVSTLAQKNDTDSYKAARPDTQQNKNQTKMIEDPLWEASTKEQNPESDPDTVLKRREASFYCGGSCT